MTAMSRSWRGKRWRRRNVLGCIAYATQTRMNKDASNEDTVVMMGSRGLMCLSDDVVVLLSSGDEM